MCYSIVMCSICGSVCTCLYVSLSIYIHQPSGTFTHTTLHQILCPNMRPSSILQVAVNQKKASMGIYIYIYIHIHMDIMMMKIKTTNMKINMNTMIITEIIMKLNNDVAGKFPNHGGFVRDELTRRKQL